jgi:hypothetical protein
LEEETAGSYSIAPYAHRKGILLGYDGRKEDVVYESFDSGLFSQFRRELNRIATLSGAFITFGEG